MLACNSCDVVIEHLGSGLDRFELGATTLGMDTWYLQNQLNSLPNHPNHSDKDLTSSSAEVGSIFRHLFVEEA